MSCLCVTTYKGTIPYMSISNLVLGTTTNCRMNHFPRDIPNQSIRGKSIHCLLGNSNQTNPSSSIGHQLELLESTTGRGKWNERILFQYFLVRLWEVFGDGMQFEGCSDGHKNLL